MKNLKFPLKIVNKKSLMYFASIVLIGFIIFGYAAIINSNVAVAMVSLFTVVFIIGLKKFNAKKKISNTVLIVINAIIISTLSSLFSRVDAFTHPTPILSFLAKIISIVFGIFVILLSSLLLYVMIKSLMTKVPNIIIDSDGIKINSSEPIFARQILWADIEEVSTSVTFTTATIDLKLKNPQAYQSTIDNQKNSIRRWFMNYLFKKSGGVVKLSSTGTNISFKDLEYIVRENFEAKRAA